MNRMLNFILQLLLETPGNISGSPGKSGKDGPNSADDDLKYLREGEKDDKKSGKEKDESDKTGDEDIEEDNTEDVDGEKDEDDEEKKDDEEGTEDEDDEEENGEEQEEIVGALVTAKDLKEKYPDIFKKVPELKAVIYREQQYSQLFADPAEAQEAAQNAATFREMEEDLVKGDIEPLLQAVKGTKEADFVKLAASVLPALKKLDEPTFMKVIAVPFKQMLRTAFRNGQAKGNKNLMYAAQHIHDFIFDDTNLDEKTEFEGNSIKVSPDEEKYKKKLEELDARDHANFKKSVDSEWVDGVQEAFMDRLDPDNSLSKWTKDKMLEEAIKEINKQLTADSRHMKNMEVLWRNAKASGYNAESKSRIVNTALARAKQLIPTVRQKVRSEASAKGERKVESKEKKVFRAPEETNSNGRQRDKSNRRPDPRKTEEMSDLDIIRS